MKPGRELDALVAKHVFCHRVLRTPCDNLWWLQGGNGGDGEPLPMPVPVPAYSTDITAAWEVFERVEFGVLSGPEKTSGRWCCSVGVGRIDSTWGDTAPHAICLAALKAVGVEVSG